MLGHEAALAFGSFVSAVFATVCFGDLLAIRRTLEVRDFMAEAFDQAQHEFWRAPIAAVGDVVDLAENDERSATCRCGTEFMVGSLYCHVCGARRPGLNDGLALRIPGLAELAALRERLALTTPSLVAFLVGVLCLVGALAVSVFFSARTALDWQAIQLWRIEWLLGAVAAFGAGCLLKK